MHWTLLSGVHVKTVGTALHCTAMASTDDAQPSRALWVVTAMKTAFSTWSRHKSDSPRDARHAEPTDWTCRTPLGMTSTCDDESTHATAEQSQHCGMLEAKATIAADVWHGIIMRSFVVSTCAVLWWANWRLEPTRHWYSWASECVYLVHTVIYSSYCTGCIYRHQPGSKASLWMNHLGPGDCLFHCASAFYESRGPWLLSLLSALA